MNRSFATAVLLATTMGFATCGWAQTNPSVDQLINSLKPTAKSVQGSQVQGIRRLDSPSDSSAPLAHAGATTPRTGQQRAALTQTGPDDAEAPSANLYVPFANGSAELTPQAMEALDKLGTALTSSALSSYRFRIEGHTDTVGSKEYNLALSERRAKAVVSYIERKFGLDAGHLVAVGLGADHLLVQTPDQTPEARNRRVEIINLGA